MRELDTLYQAGKPVASLLSSAQLLECILDVVFYVTSAEEAALMRVDEGSGQLRTKLHSQRAPGGVHRLPHGSAEELAAQAARKGDAADGGTRLCAPLKLGDGVIGVLGVGKRLRAPCSATPDSAPQGGHRRVQAW